MPTIVATKNYPYGTRKLKVGDRFEATDRDADLLVKVGMATPVEAEKPKRQYKRRDLQAEE